MPTICCVTIQLTTQLTLHCIKPMHCTALCSKCQVVRLVDDLPGRHAHLLYAYGGCVVQLQLSLLSNTCFRHLLSQVRALTGTADAHQLTTGMFTTDAQLTIGRCIQAGCPATPCFVLCLHALHHQHHHVIIQTIAIMPACIVS